MDLARSLGWLPDSQYRRSPRAKPLALLAWHGADYLAALQRAEQLGAISGEDLARFNLGTPSNPVFAQMFRRPATGAGGVMLAAELVLNGGVVHVPGGGTHHGMPGRANGFCYLNDPVLCILALRRLGLVRIAYVDIDAHHPDGVEHGFAGDPHVLLISVHEEKRWPFTGALTATGGGNCFNLPVPAGLNDSEMQLILQRLILPKVQAFAPQAVILQCGADALAEDPLSRLMLSNNSHLAVVAALRELAGRFIVLGGGGYNPWSVGRCWAAVWAVLSGQDIPDILPGAAQDVLRGLEWRRLPKGQRPPEAWLTTLRDPPRNGPVRADLTDRLAYLQRRNPVAGDAIAL